MMPAELAPWLPLVIFVIALLYSTVGHGGASGYLAALAIANVPIAALRPSALMLNLVVSCIAFAQFRSAGHFRWKLFWPFAIASVPAAFIGAGIALGPVLYKQLLALCLLFAVGRLMGVFGSWRAEPRRMHIPLALSIGLVIGLLSGMIGIGGGVILSPVLLLLRWATAHEAAAVSALFIFVNSSAGLIGIGDLAMPVAAGVFWWLAAAILGGLTGAFLGARRTPPVRMRQLLGMVLLAASVKLLVP